MNMRGEMLNETPFIEGNSSVHESKISSGTMFVGLCLDRISDVQNLEDTEWIVVGWCHLIPIIGWCRLICFGFFDGGIVQGIYISLPLFIEELMPIAILIAIWMWPWINCVARGRSMLISSQNSLGLWTDTCSTCVCKHNICCSLDCTLKDDGRMVGKVDTPIKLRWMQLMVRSMWQI